MQELVARDFVQEQPPPLADGEIHLWFFAQWPTPAHDVAQSLPLRALLAGYLESGPERLRIERNMHGKPGLRDAAGLEFNLSHSGGALLVGVSRGQALGTDLETPRRLRPVLDLARRYFDPAEAALLAGLPADRREAAFMRLWSCKEAVLKALGHGIAFGLHRLVFELDASGRVLGLQKLDGEPTPALWHVVQLRPAPAYSGAVAWRGPARRIHAYAASPPMP
ncbi:MAG: 4'-phosphopantetheinyl transferase superfamily protein [Rudaea sp.]|nr:4'-phosphopantetheinyl transferase superfamily protein [Rudaea sp.]